MEPFIGQVMMFGGNFAPRGWAFCDGQLLSIQGNEALFSILGTTYGGDGRTNFGLPDLRGRAPVHAGGGAGPGLTPRRLGDRGGAESVTLTSAEMPAHSHDVNCAGVQGTQGTPVGNFLAGDRDGADDVYHDALSNPARMNSNALSSVGSGGAHENMAPFLAINYVIALQGIYPSRS